MKGKNKKEKFSNDDANPVMGDPTPPVAPPEPSAPPTPPPGTPKVPAWVSWSPYAGLAAGLGFGLLRKSGILGYALYGGIGFIAFQAIKMYYSEKVSASSDNVDTKISSLIDAMAAKNNISAANVTSAKNWVNTNLNSNEKQMFLDLYSSTTGTSAATDATSVLSLGVSDISEYGIGATTAFMSKVGKFNVVLNQGAIAT